MTVFRNLLIAKSTATRPYYCEVEYLESNSAQQRISTGIMVDTLPITVDVSFSTASASYNSTYQVIVGTVTGDQYFIGFISGDPAFAIKYNNVTYNTNIVPVADTIYRLTSTISNSDATLNINGTNYTNTMTYTANNEEIGLFAQKYGTKSNRIHACKIYKGSTLVRDFIPVLDWDMAPCMYDKVSGELFYNQGTGNFIAGRQIHPVEYLGFTGTQYIDTDLFAASDLKVECECSTSTADGSNNPLFGGREAPAVNSFTVWRHLISSAAPRFDFGGNQRGASQNLEADVWYKITKDGADNYIDDVPQLSNSDATFESETIKMIIGGVRSGTSTISYIYYKGKIKSAKCWKAGVLKHDFIPAIDSDGVGFMFDRVSHTIHDNAGTGVFEYPPVQLEYIETDGTSYINTGYTPSGSTETEITTMLKDQTTSRFMFGCRTAQSNNTYACLAHNQNRIGYRVGASGGYFYSNGYNELNVKHTYKIANGVFYRDGEVVDATCEGATTSPNSPLALLTINTNNVLDVTQPFVGNFYSCTMKENSTLVRDFIPCYKDGVVGMWDKVNEVFYANAGQGAFTAGKIKEER